VRTVGKRWPATAPRGDHQALCDYCGVQWRRSRLRRDADGLLRCPDEGAGRAEGELNAANARDARHVDRVRPRSGKVDRDDGSDTPTQRTTLEDIEI
jgi:hypothetical protein